MLALGCAGRAPEAEPEPEQREQPSSQRSAVDTELELSKSHRPLHPTVGAGAQLS